MKNFKSGGLFLLVFIMLAGCGDQLVEFPLDGGATGPDAGVGIDSGTAVDAGIDADPGSRPTVIATAPADDALDVSVNKRVTATFSRPMSPATLTATSFTVRQGATPIPGEVSYEGATNTATFIPTSQLDISLEYTGTITTVAADPQGTTLASDYVWTFSTGACSQEAVALRSVGGFGVLGGSTVTSTGETSVTGDLGVSPGTEVVGFPPGILVGDEHAGTPTSATAMADLTTAYDDAAARTLCSTTVDGNLGGMTLAPGLYTSASSLEISSGDLTLDAQGDADAVFIFQMDSTFTTSPGRQVILAGGARAENIYWQVGSSATLGTTTAFHGTIMADQAVTLGTGTTLTGRALARIGAVSLDSNTLVIP